MVQQLTKREREALHMRQPDEHSMRVSMALDRENQTDPNRREQVIKNKAYAARLRALKPRRPEGVPA